MRDLIEHLESLAETHPVRFGDRTMGYDVRKSGIHGHGMHAVRAFGRGQKIAVIMRKDEKGPHRGNDGKMYFQTKFGDYVNHSRSPNMGMEWTGEDLIALAARDIEPDEELTIDYRDPVVPVDEP